MTDTSLDSLDPRFLVLARPWAEIVTAHLLPVRFPGYTMRISETRRDAAEQAANVASGASRVKTSWHQFGLALDFAIIDPSKKYLEDDGPRIYEACGKVAEALGCEWGGRWASFRDYGHIQFRPDGMTLDHFIASLSA